MNTACVNKPVSNLKYCTLDNSGEFLEFYSYYFIIMIDTVFIFNVKGLQLWKK